MKLRIEPLVALYDRKTSFSVSDVPAHGKAKIRPSMNLPWVPRVMSESAAWFTADEDGQVDLSRQKPDSWEMAIEFLKKGLKA